MNSDMELIKTCKQVEIATFTEVLGLIRLHQQNPHAMKVVETYCKNSIDAIKKSMDKPNG